jgi:hypothetical protein
MLDTFHEIFLFNLTIVTFYQHDVCSECLLVLWSFSLKWKIKFAYPQFVYMPVCRRDIPWYSVVRLSVWTVKAGWRRTAGSRTIQLGLLDHHHERMNPIVLQVQKSKFKFVAKKKNLVGTIELQDYTTWYTWSPLWVEKPYIFSGSEVKGQDCSINLN